MVDSTISADSYFQKQINDPIRKKELTDLFKPAKTKENEGKAIYVAKPMEPQEMMRIVKQFDKSSFEEYGFGCIIGNFLADAIGSKNEFVSTCLNDEQLQETMKMPGGGQHKVAPGQGTDDSELATALMLGIIDQNFQEFITKGGACKVKLNMDKVCFRYKQWYNSSPFDCGSTVRGSLGALTRHWRELQDDWNMILRESQSKDIYKVAQAVNNNSKSNGSLMKICPLAVWATEVLKDTTEENEKHFQEIINKDSQIIHSEKMTGACIFVYSATVAFLINHRNEKDRAQKALDYATELAAKKFAHETADDGKASPSIWIQDAKDLWQRCLADDKYIFNPTNTEPEKYRCTEAIGFIKHCFILSYYYLAKAAHQEDGAYYYDLENERGKEFYFQAIREVISLGGDTDTNACIVGGIIGAYVGVSNITDSLLEVYFNYDNKKEKFLPDKGQVRPEWLNMGRNTMDACFWLHILRYKHTGGPAKIEFPEDDPIIIPPDQEIKN